LREIHPWQPGGGDAPARASSVFSPPPKRGSGSGRQGLHCNGRTACFVLILFFSLFRPEQAASGRADLPSTSVLKDRQQASACLCIGHGAAPRSRLRHPGPVAVPAGTGLCSRQARTTPACARSASIAFTVFHRQAWSVFRPKQLVGAGVSVHVAAPGRLRLRKPRQRDRSVFRPERG